MLSRKDIEKELGKSICIHPLDTENIKENSINLCAGDYAWSLKGGIVYLNKKDKAISLEQDDTYTERYEISKLKSAVIDMGKDEKYIALLPQSTTLIETKEVLATSGNVGGTYHSKVGMVSQGIGHIGTMLGPNFSGNSLIALHNITEKLIIIKVGESFVSVVFHYLDTAIYEKNPTVSGHVDKMSELGIVLTKSERADLTADWKSKFQSVSDIMINSDTFKDLKSKLKKEKWGDIASWINKGNLFTLSILIAITVGLFFCAMYLDKTQKTTIWTDRYWNIIGSGVIVTIITLLISKLGKRSR